MLGALLVPQVIESWAEIFLERFQLCAEHRGQCLLWIHGATPFGPASGSRCLMEARRKDELTDELINELVMDNWPVGEKIANKDIKLELLLVRNPGGLSWSLMSMISSTGWFGRRRTPWFVR